MCIQLNLLLLPLGVWWQDRSTIFNSIERRANFQEAKNQQHRAHNKSMQFRSSEKKKESRWSGLCLARVHYANRVAHWLIYRSRYNSLSLLFFAIDFILSLFFSNRWYYSILCALCIIIFDSFFFFSMFACDVYCVNPPVDIVVYYCCTAW